MTTASPESVPQSVRATEWQKLDAAADARSGNEAEDAFNIGRRDGFSEAIQLIDQMTGGDGEYRYIIGLQASPCSDPDEMIETIVARLPIPATPATPNTAVPEGMVLAVREAFPADIGRLHLGEERSDGERLCEHSHEVPAGHPLYWPQMISQYDDSDPYCLEHAIDLVVSDNSWSEDETATTDIDHASLSGSYGGEGGADG